MPESRQRPRLTSKDPLHKAVTSIASDRELVPDSKPKRWKLFLNTEASKILLKVANDNGANFTWEFVRRLDQLEIYGKEIVVGFKEHCFSDLEWFIACIKTGDRAFIKTIEKLRA